MFKKFMRETVFALIAGVLLCSAGITDSRAASNISDTDKYAWSETAGWNNFNPGHANASVTVYGDHLEGYAWAENIGWMKLDGSTGSGSPYYDNTSNTDWGVNNDGSGTLSGFAWSEIAGWINFKPGDHSGVTIDADGNFDGYAWGENVGWIHFQNTSPAYKVSTTWIPNTAPVITAITPDSTTIVEGDSVSLDGSFTDDDAGDSHDVTISWGDDSTDTEFTLAAGTLSFADKTHTYTDDGTYTITVTVDDGTASDSDNSTTVSVVIPTVAFSSATYSDAENVGTSNSVTLSRTVFTNCVTEVSVLVTGGDASGGTDYDNSGFPMTVTFGADEESKTVSVPITDDAADEEDETITFTVSSVSNAEVGAQAGTTLTITDNDTAGGLTVTESDGSTAVSESGTTDAFTVVLTARPGSDVVIDVSSADTGEAAVSPASLTFTKDNWDTAQTVTVTGVDDTSADGGQTTIITLAVNGGSSDDAFDTIENQTVTVTTADDDTAGFTVTQSDGATAVNESGTGTTDTFTVVLNTRPSSDVVIDVSSADTGEATVSPGSLTFTGDNWDTPQTVTVTGVDDGLTDEPQTVTVTLDVSASGDDDFDSVPDKTVTVTVFGKQDIKFDDMTAGFSVRADADGTGTVSAGDTLTCAVGIPNTGNSDAKDVTYTLPVPENTVFNEGTLTSAVSSPGTGTLRKAVRDNGTVSYNSSQNQIEWNGDIPAGAELGITFDVTVDDDVEEGDEITVGGILTYDSDGDGENDTDTSDGSPSPTPIGDAPDSDNDGIPDWWESQHGLDPDNADDAAEDTDGDGLSDLSEYMAGTAPDNADSDGDGVSDGDEIEAGTDPADGTISDPEDVPDTDKDGIPDWVEERHGTDPQTDDASVDSDNDGLSNAEELAAGSNPANPDSDGDGVSDGDEVAAGTDPIISEVVPGDMHGDGKVDLKDAILCLKVLAGFADPGKINLTADVNSDGRIGFEDMFFVLEKLVE